MAGTSYRQIEQDMRRKIRSGKWSSGSLLPSRRDLAREYGVTNVTVQRAISCLIDDGTLRAEARKGTFVADEPATERPSGLRDTIEARGITSASLTIGIVAALPLRGPDFESHIAVQAIERMYSEQRMSTRFVNLLRSTGERIGVDAAIDQLAADQVDGIIIVFNDEPDRVKLALNAVKRTDTPLVYVTSRELDAPLPHVYFDNCDAGYQAAAHLLEQGCSALAMIAPFVEDWALDRARGMQHALRIAELPQSALRMYPQTPAVSPWNSPGGAYTYEQNKQITQAAAYECGRRFFAEGSAPDGIIAANDHVAFGVIRAAEEAGKHAGEDFLLMGFDDVPEARTVNLTTMRAPLEWMGNEAANMLLDAIGGKLRRQQVKLRSHLVTRGSTCRISRPLRASMNDRILSDRI